MNIIIFKGGTFIDIELNLNEVTSFGVYNDTVYYKNGNVRGFLKKGYIDHNGQRIICLPRFINDLKEHFCGKYKTTKEKVSHLKRDYSRMEAINWSYDLALSNSTALPR